MCREHRREAGTNMSVKICIVSSCGGHLTEVRALRSAYEQYQHFYVLNDRVLLPLDMTDRTYFIRHAERNWLVLVNLWEAWTILRKERPTIILSTGAGPVVPFALIGKLFGIRSIFVETFARVTEASWSGAIMYRIADRFFYQWESLRVIYPKGIFGGWAI
jgi:beta-1,4-N-acetylglucosaminyltransferase